MMKKAVCTFLVILLLLMLIPIHVTASDGGSDGWHAILWQYTESNELAETDDGQFALRAGPRITIFGFITIYDGTYLKTYP